MTFDQIGATPRNGSPKPVFVSWLDSDRPLRDQIEPFDACPDCHFPINFTRFVGDPAIRRAITTHCSNCGAVLILTVDTREQAAGWLAKLQERRSGSTQ